MNINFVLNDTPVSVDVIDENTPLLWIIRDTLHLLGTKFGCGKAACGACTLHVDGSPVRSCSFPVKFAANKKVTTIEGLGTTGSLHAVQQAWIEEIVPQCGYCQSGFMMVTAAFLAQNQNPTNDEIDQNIKNICRCGTYYRMRKAIHRAAEILRLHDPEKMSVDEQ